MCEWWAWWAWWTSESRRNRITARQHIGMAEVMLAGDVGMIWSWQVVVLHMMSMACGGNTHDGSWHVVVLHMMGHGM